MNRHYWATPAYPLYIHKAITDISFENTVKNLLIIRVCREINIHFVKSVYTCIKDLIFAKCVSIAPPWGKLEDILFMSSQKQLYAMASVREGQY